MSLLEKYNITEKQALDICRENGLLSPVYDFVKRNGCWFCPNARDDEWAHMIYKHETVFDILIELEQKAEGIAKRVTRTETPTQLKQRILSYGEQVSLFGQQGN